MAGQSARLSRELRAIRRSFEQIARAFERLRPALVAVSNQPGKGSEGQRMRRSPRLTAQQRAALKLQGKYMGTMRGLPAAKRAQVKKIRSTKGIRAAIAAARKMAS